MKIITTIIGILGLTAVPSLFAQGCCGGEAGNQSGCPMAGHMTMAGHEAHGLTPVSTQTSGPRQVFVQPVQSVYDNYMKVQGVLANDSLEGVSATASAMAKAVRGDSMKMLPPKVAEQAEALAKAQNLANARAAFKGLSESLISYLKTQKLPAGSYYVAYCPMAKASWLQTDKTIINPYMGKSMVHCGQIQS